jgi:hypothetical protein
MGPASHEREETVQVSDNFEQNARHEHSLVKPSRDGEKQSVAFDYEKTLRDNLTKHVTFFDALYLNLLSRRMNDSGVKRRELGVMFQNLRVVGLSAASSFQPTFGSVFNPNIIWETIQNARHPHVRDILSGFEGVVRPGEMLCSLLNSRFVN